MSEKVVKRKLYGLEEKLRLLDEADKPGEGVGTVARKHGVSPSIMFKWRQLRESGALTGLKDNAISSLGLKGFGRPSFMA